MSRHLYQTTFTFRDAERAAKFIAWLRRNRNDADYGHPTYIGQISVGLSEVCVEYRADNEMPRGVATGIDL